MKSAVLVIMAYLTVVSVCIGIGAMTEIHPFITHSLAMTAGIYLHASGLKIIAAAQEKV